MALANSPRIVTDGLVLAFDGANDKYNGTEIIPASWEMYQNNQTHYRVLAHDSVYLKNTFNNWLGYFNSDITTTGLYGVTFTYFADSASVVLLDNDGANNNAFNVTLNATTTPQVYTGYVNMTGTGNVRHFFRRSSGGNITIKDFQFFKLGTTITDITGGNDGVMTDGDINLNGVNPNKYYVFSNSTANHIAAPNPLAGTIESTPFTMEAWALRTTSNAWQTIMMIDSSHSQLAFNSSNNISGGRNGGSGNANISSGVSTSTNTWYHIVQTYDGNASGDNRTVKIYVDGELKITGGMGNNGNNNGTSVRLGTFGPVERLGGYISVARLYNRPLSAEEVRQNYNALKTRFDPNL